MRSTLLFPRWPVLFIAAMVLAFTSLHPAEARAAQKRVALVIGNSAYIKAGRLRNPKTDASDFANKLEALGFDVVRGIDLDGRKMTAAIRTFRRKLDGAAVALFYYAGHGIQVNGQNYLLPVDADIVDEYDVQRQTIALNSVLREMETRTPVNLVFLDACRNNPVANKLIRTKRGASRGLARVQTSGTDTLIAFAAAPGKEAADGDGRNSPFTTALLKHMATPGLEISLMFKRVIRDVRRTTRGRQRPQQLSDMAREFYFNPAPTTGQKTDQKLAAIPPSDQSAATSPEDDRELMFWKFTEEMNTRAAYRAFVKRYPNSRFLPRAQRALTTLRPDTRPAPGSDHKTPKDWRRILGGRGIDEGYAVRQTRDGGYIIVGRTSSKGLGRSDAYVVRLDASGAVVWEKTFGGAHVDVAQDVVVTRDGGFIIAGYTGSKGWGQLDGWVFKLSRTGRMVWEQAFGGRRVDMVKALAQLSDGSVIVTGYTMSKGAGRADLWVVKFGPDGTRLWEKTYGDRYQDMGEAILTDDLDNILIAGTTDRYGLGNTRAWFLKLNGNGDLINQFTIGGRDERINVTSLILLPGGSFLMAGARYRRGLGKSAWLAQFNAGGRVKWTRTVPGLYNAEISALAYNAKTGLILVGGQAEQRRSSNKPGLWLGWFDGNGQMRQSRIKEADSQAAIYGMSLTRDGGLVYAGKSRSETNRSEDLVVSKLASSG